MTSLNESQKRSLLFGCLDIHRRLADMEAMLVQSAISSPFSQYGNDLSPTEGRVVQDSFARIRTTMHSCLEEAGIPLEVRRTSLRWALQCGMTFLHIAVADMGPERLRGYGPLDAAGQAATLKIQQDLTRLIDRVGTYVYQGLGRDVAERLARLETAPVSAATLTVLDRVILHWQLVEFRPLLDTLVRRLEAPQFEVAVFGRVSSGKSSLLNHLVGRDVLPVGVTPITAVPTRLLRGDRPAALVSFAELEPRTVSVEELPEYVSEEGNPGNHKHVTDTLVQLPAPHLREGVVLVDTPGIGSLAQAGGAETFAYLPRCDLGVVLIDAASTLNPDDLLLLRTLYEAGVPAQVVLSKADLLTPTDRERMASYIREHLQREFGLEVPVHPVSTVGGDEALLTRWFEQEIEPLLLRHRALTEASLRRKIAHLRESVMAVLQTLLAKEQGELSDDHAKATGKAVRQFLDEADSAIQQARAQCREWAADEAALVEVILQDAARAILAPRIGPHAAQEAPVLSVVRQVLTQRDQLGHQVVTQLQQALGRTLESLRQTAPLAQADVDAVQSLVFRGLPAIEHFSLRMALHRARPWWAALLPCLAVWATRRHIDRHLGAALREQVGLHDRQLQDWLNKCLGQLIEAYEAQAEVFREQVRRLTGEGDGARGATDWQLLKADLQELQQTQLPEPESAPALASGKE